MAGSRRDREAQIMGVTLPAGRREPDNELFDHGCDLVQAAAAIRRAAAAGSTQTARAVPAVLGCIESALEELFWASAMLEATTADALAERQRRRPDPRTTARVERMHRGYANLQRALDDATSASSAARSLARRAVAG
jgi:hypothetical protein